MSVQAALMCRLVVYLVCVVQPSNGQAVSDAHGGSPAAQPTAQTAGILVDVAGESSTPHVTAQPVADIDAAVALPEDSFNKYLSICCCVMMSLYGRA